MNARLFSTGYGVALFLCLSGIDGAFRFVPIVIVGLIEPFNILLKRLEFLPLYATIAGALFLLQLPLRLAHFGLENTRVPVDIDGARLASKMVFDVAIRRLCFFHGKPVLSTGLPDESVVAALCRLRHGLPLAAGRRFRGRGGR